eukprot:TRINITY_DN31851_c0_g1_i1.p1 TRINITY_DN31851_c0_g1~~TRINITY_DN31851_c0_g1_i1.p1  ORF type:complete len:588 (-),score=117.62 TRINITY_DN31851_c0_g1_i1:93-1856(-)
MSFQPTALDLRRLLGRAYRFNFRAHLELEATSGGFEGEKFEVILCSAKQVGGDLHAARLLPLYIPIDVPRGAERHLQVLNAVPTDKRVMANSSIGIFKVRHVIDLTGCPDRIALSVLMHKAGDFRDRPANISFDSRSLMPPEDDRTGGVGEAWSLIGDAALTSLDPIVIMETCHSEKSSSGLSDHDWYGQVLGRCAFLQIDVPQIQVSRPMGPAESKVQQWSRLRPSCLLHCASEAGDATKFLQGGLAVLRQNGGIALPATAEGLADMPLPPVVILDRCNSERVDRRQWMQNGGLKKTEVVAVHFDVDLNECINRVATRGDKHPVLKVSSLTQAASAVQSQADLLEPPAERDGFKAVVRLQGTAALVDDLVRRWTQEFSSDSDGPTTRRAPLPTTGVEDEEEAPPPPLPSLNQWIEVQENVSGCMMWGAPSQVPWGCVDQGMMEQTHTSASSSRGARYGGYGVQQQMHQPLMSRTAWGEPQHQYMDMEQMDYPEMSMSTGSGANPWMHSPHLSSSLGPDASQHPPELLIHTQEPDDDEEWARQEQLAATLRCMGFDEEPSLQAAQRAGGNLNRAVEEMINQRRSAAG